MWGDDIGSWRPFVWRDRASIDRQVCTWTWSSVRVRKSIRISYQSGFTGAYRKIRISDSELSIKPQKRGERIIGSKCVNRGNTFGLPHPENPALMSLYFRSFFY